MIDPLKAGNDGVPDCIASRADEAINGCLADRLPQVTGLDIQQLSFVEGGIDDKGTAPQVYEAAPPVTGQLP